MSENKYRCLFELAHDSIFIIDPQSRRFIDVNENAANRLGYTKDELLQLTIDDIDHLQSAAMNARILAELEKTGSIVFERVHIRKDGTHMPVEISSCMIHDGSRKVIQSIVRDITQRKEAEQEIQRVQSDLEQLAKDRTAELSESEARMRLLLESIGEGVIGVDLNGRCKFINPAALRLLGYRDSSQLIGVKLHPKIHHTRREGSPCPDEECQICRAFREEKSFYVDDEVMWRADGTCFDVEYRSNPIYLGGKVVGSVVTFVDITQRKQAEDKLRLAATVFKNTDEGIIVANAERKIIAVNGAFTKISGYRFEEVLGENPNFQQSGVHNEAFYRKLWSRLERKGQWRGEIWNRRKNGEIFPVWENISVVKDKHGKITNYVSIFSDISSIKESEKRLSHLAHHDALTGLSNRLMLTANLDQTLEWAKRYNQKVALLFLDLDRFKIINDTLGHAYGDQLLKAVAKRLKQCVRAVDTVARLGGDEFTIILAEITNAEDAAKIAEKINENLAQPVPVEDQELVTSSSIGISIYPDDARNRQDLLKAADTAMYYAKECGRNTFRFYRAELTTKAFEHLSLERGLRRALEHDEFELYYQPQVALDSGKIVGVEALIRWRHPKRGLLAPSTFIPIAEETGLIDPIGEWVFRTACAQAKAWHSEGLPSVRLAINLSERQILSERNLGKIHTILQDLGLNPGILQLDLEITERILQIAEQSIDVLSQLKSWGFMLAIDDFGTGYSSLSRLKQLPIDTLKIDRSFVRNIPQDRDDKAIVKAIIAMGHGLKLNVIAEGAETKDQLAFLHEQGCDELQGYIFSEPVPANVMRRLLKERRQLNLSA